jgi:lipoprotein-releasing system ATP-binding protein
MGALIEVEGLEKTFQTPAGELRVLKGIDAAFARGELVSIMGASGAGKSTFLHILGTLDAPTTGKIQYRVSGQSGAGGDGAAVDPFSLGGPELASFRNRVIGFVFQFHYLLPEFSALENVMMPGLIALSGKAGQAGREELKSRAEKLLDELGLFARKDHKPGELSGGEQQRVAVARALLLEPEVVLADEPTGNLDTATGEELFRLIMDINSRKGVTFIIVTHNESLSRRCHRIMEMADGKLVRG